MNEQPPLIEGNTNYLSNVLPRGPLSRSNWNLLGEEVKSLAPYPAEKNSSELWKEAAIKSTHNNPRSQESNPGLMGEMPLFSPREHKKTHSGF